MRLAVISDIHFGSLSRSSEFAVPGEKARDTIQGTHSLEDGFVKLIKEHNVKYLVIAGDLTSVGSPQEFYYCEKKILSMAHKADISTDKIIISLGNHDIDWRITQIHEQYTESDTPPYLRKLIKEKYENISAHVSTHNMVTLMQPEKKGPFPYSGVLEKEDIIFFVLNSGFQCTHDQSIKHGKLSNIQLDWYGKISECFVDDPRKKILLLHHHVHNYKYNLPGLDISTLEEGAEIESLSGKIGIDLIIHGHRHHPRATTRFETGWKKPVSFLCAGSFSVDSTHRSYGEIPNTFHIVEFTEDNNILTLFNYQFKNSSGWIPLEKNCDETPLDHKMKLGCLMTDKELIDEIQKLPFNDTWVKWEELSDRLKCVPCNELNEKIWEVHSQNYKIGGGFPKEIMFQKKGGKC